MKIEYAFAVTILLAMAPVGYGKNLVPNQVGTAPNYWATWAAQNYLFGQDANKVDIKELRGIPTCQHAEDLLNEEVIFSEDGWVNFFPKARADLYFLLDEGYYPNPTGKAGYGELSSCEFASQKFPFLTGTPVEQLKQFNARLKEAGWRGLALWLRDPPSDEKYMRERMLWCKEAGIYYWKIDGGDFDFQLPKLAREVFPELVMEHATYHTEALNKGPDGRAGDHYALAKNGLRLNILKNSNVLRIYDRDTPLSVPTSLDRVVALLQIAADQPDAKAIINCEDEVYMGAALGCSIGVFRHSHIGRRPGEDMDVFLAGPRQIKKRIDEVARAVRWHRMAPPYAANAGPVAIDDRVLTDVWYFRPGDTWDATLDGLPIGQVAPARVARGIPLPEVLCDGEPPFVVAGKNPNGALSIATLGRTSNSKGWVIPEADVIVRAGPVPPAIGVFGRFRSLQLVFDKPRAVRKVWAQDLAGDEAVDITSQVTQKGQRLIVPGSIIEKVGLSAATPWDLSDPGLVLVIE